MPLRIEAADRPLHLDLLPATLRTEPVRQQRSAVGKKRIDLAQSSGSMGAHGDFPAMEIKNRNTAQRSRAFAWIAVVLAFGSTAFSQAGIQAVETMVTDQSGTVVVGLDESSCSRYIQGRVTPFIAAPIAGSQLRLNVDNHEGLLILPDSSAQTASIPWVWFAPMVTGQPNEHHAFIVESILKAGMAFAAIDVGESYGNPAGSLLYEKFHDVLNSCFGLSRKAVLFPQSRGGLMLFNWAVQHSDEVERIAGIYPVCDLRSYPGLKTASEAYGMTEVELKAQLEKHNPIDFVAVLAKQNVPILMIHGDSDKIVPLQDNSAEFVRRYLKLGGPIRLVVVPGKGHEEVDEFFKSSVFVAFLISGN